MMERAPGPQNASTFPVGTVPDDAVKIFAGEAHQWLVCSYRGPLMASGQGGMMMEGMPFGSLMHGRGWTDGVHQELRAEKGQGWA